MKRWSAIFPNIHWVLLLIEMGPYKDREKIWPQWILISFVTRFGSRFLVSKIQVSTVKNFKPKREAFISPNKTFLTLQSLSSKILIHKHSERSQMDNAQTIILLELEILLPIALSMASSDFWIPNLNSSLSGRSLPPRWKFTRACSKSPLE